MATNEVMIKGTKLGSEGEDPIMEMKVIQVSTVQSPGALAQVVPSGHPLKLAPSSVPLQTGQTSSSPVMVVAKVTAPGATVAVTKTTLSSAVQVNPAPTQGRTVVITVPRASHPVAVAPRVTQTTSAQLPANIHFPPGMMLIRSDSGQLMMVSQQALAQAQEARRASSGPQNSRIITPPPTPSPIAKTNEKATVIRMSATPNLQSTPVRKTALVKVLGVPPNPAVVQNLSAVLDRNIQPRIITEPKKEAPPTFSQEMLESVKKCKNFLVTLIKLASSDSRSANIANNVRGLVRSLLEGELGAEEFTEQLYCELKSTPQPCLVPFLKKSLPAVRILTPDPQVFIQQAATSARNSSVKQPTTDQGPSTKSQQQVMPQPRRVSVTSGWVTQTKCSRILPRHAGLQSAKHFTGTLSVRQNHDQPRSTNFRDTSGSYKEDDDINDVASMAGVNLREESAQIITSVVGSVVQSCQDQLFLSPNQLLNQILQAGQAFGVTEVAPDVVALVSHAAQECLRNLVEKLTVMAQHRKNVLKDDPFHAKMSDVRTQLHFLEEVETLKKKRKDEEERDRLLRLARSRSHIEDPELLLLKQRAKELQQLEQAQLQQREANITALAAIGPRKKRTLEQLDGQVCVLPRPSIQRVTRVTLRDLLQCMEQDLFLQHSLTLYKAML